SLYCRGDRYLLVDVRGLWQRGHRRGLSASRHRPSRCCAAFGLTVVTMAYAIGHISGCHLNPAVTVGLTAGGRFPPGQVIPYIIAQLVGAIVAALLLYAVAKGAPGFDLGKGFATNGYAEHSPGHYDLLSALLTEVVMTMLFLFVIMGSTHGKAPA